jgi:hypothetical protein
MTFDRLDAASRKELFARMVLEKRTAEREKKTFDKTLKTEKSEKRWQPLSVPSAQTSGIASSYLCACMDVKRGFAVVCPPHMLSFH